MKLHQLSLFLLGLLLGAVALAQGTPQPNAQAMLQASDAVRNPDKAFGVTVTLIEYRNGELIEEDAPASTASRTVLPGEAEAPAEQPGLS